MKKKLGIVVLTVLAAIGLVVIGRTFSGNHQVYINEVRSWDADVTRDGYYGSDYIELYNASDEEISLEGWYVSDDESELKKCRLYDAVIGPKDYLLLYANGENDSGVSLNFKINPAGEKIFLSDAEGRLVDSIYVPEQELGTVYARVTDGAGEWAVMESSFLKSNDESSRLPVRSLKAPEFSHESGFYEEAFTLTLEAEEGQTIYYTLDGSEPTKESAVYDGGILIENRSSQPNVLGSVKNVVLNWLDYEPDETPVDKAVIVRAAAMDEQNRASEVLTKTYFVGLDDYMDRNVISVVADFEEMFGEEGIFSTGAEYDEWYLSGGEEGVVTPSYRNSGRKWEIRGNVEILESGNEILNQKIGVRTQGGSARDSAKKLMSIFAREEYSGNDYLEGISFDGKRAHSVVFNLMSANVVLPELVKDRDVSRQKAIDNVWVFLNGEYWYEGYLLEKYNKYYLEENYDVSRDNVIIIKNEDINEGPENSYAMYAEMLAYAANTDLSIDENYAKLEEMVDMQSYIDYICANTYLCNMDMSEKKNYMIWRTVTDEGTEMGDGRWRWMLYDMDCVRWLSRTYYGVENKWEIDSFSQEMQYTGSAVNEHVLFKAAQANEGFRKQFVLTFMDMANVNFSQENVDAAFAKYQLDEPTFRRFFKYRYDSVVPYMAKEFALTGTLEEVTLKVNDTQGGTIILNTTVPDVSNGSWTGKYYTDYPVTVTAVPEEGYVFKGWSGSVTSNSATIEAEVLTGGITLEAVFEKAAE